jgi:hypothetical protein
MAASANVAAITSFNCEVGGLIYVVHAGDVFARTAAIVKKQPSLFAPADRIEQATGRPVE